MASEAHGLVILPQRGEGVSPLGDRGLVSPRNPGADAVKAWTGFAGDGLWSTANNWTPVGAPLAGDTLSFLTQTNPYGVVNNQFGAGPTYASITFEGASASRPVFSGGFSTVDLAAYGTGGARLGAGSYSFSGGTTFRGQSRIDVDSSAMLQSNQPDPTMYLWEQSTLNVNAGGSVDLSGSGSVLSLDDSATLNVSAGGTVHSTFALLGNDQTSGTRTISLNGAGAAMRVDFQTLIHTAGFNAPAGMVSIDVRDGALFSSGIVEINENSTANGLAADTHITVDDATFDVSNAVGFENSYFMSGVSSGPGTTNIQLSGGGQFRVRDTDGNGQAFAVFSNSYRADTQIVVGGSNAGGTNSTLQVDGLLFVAPAIRQTTDTLVTHAEIEIGSGGQLLVRDASVFASDRSYAATLIVRPAAKADLGDLAIFSGGNAESSPDGGAGTTTVTVEGELRAGAFEYLCDSGASPGQGGHTTLTLGSATSLMIADGVDDPLTPEIDSGFFAPSRGNGGSDLAADGLASFVINGRLEANEAFFAGDMQNGSFSLDVNGTGATIDAGGLFAVNDRGLAGSATSITVRNGGTLAATTFSNGLAGSIRINSAPGTLPATVTVDASSNLISGGSIELGGRLSIDNTGLLQRTAGSPASVACDGTVTAGSYVFVAEASTLATNRYLANGTYIGGMWLVGAGGAERRIQTGNLHVFSAGSVTFTAAASPATPTLAVTRNLVVEPDATFDLKNNALLIRPDVSSSAPTSLSTVKQLLALGRQGTGGGLSSSLVGSSTALGYRLVDAAGTFLGEPTLPGDLLVRYTLKGDADLNGRVDFDDLLVVAQHYEASGEWYTGDFSFNGVVDFDDLLLVAQNYGAPLLAAGMDSSVFASDWRSARSLVPEPGLVAALLLPSIASRRRS